MTNTGDRASDVRTSPFDLDRLGGPGGLRALVSEVIAAGELARVLYDGGAGRRAERKSDASPVTEADHAVEARLRAFIASRHPGAAVLGEEQGGEVTTGASPLRFVIDPIDGTRAFMRGIPTWSVLVGVEWEGQPVVGVAYVPALDELYVAVDGQGATGNGKPLAVSGVTSLDEAVVCHGSLGQFVERDLGATLGRLARRVFTTRGFHDFDAYRYLLSGQADAVIDPAVKPWDLCAVAVLVREAGGVLTDLSGEPTIYGDGVASNGAVHSALLDVLAG